MLTVLITIFVFIFNYIIFLSAATATAFFFVCIALELEIYKYAMKFRQTNCYAHEKKTATTTNERTNGDKQTDGWRREKEMRLNRLSNIKYTEFR